MTKKNMRLSGCLLFITQCERKLKWMLPVGADSAAASVTQLQSARLAAAYSCYRKPGAQFHRVPPQRRL